MSCYFINIPQGSLPSSGVLTAAAGSIPTPGLGFQDRPGTGLSAPGAALKVSTAGVEAVHLATESRFGQGIVTRFGTGLTIDRTAHATSSRAGVIIGTWLLGQDGDGDGTENLFLYRGALNDSLLWIEPAGHVNLAGRPGTAPFRIVRRSATVNRVEVNGGQAGEAPSIVAAGSDASQHLRLSGKGAGTIILSNLPTAAAGLPAGALWNDGGTLKVT